MKSIIRSLLILCLFIGSAGQMQATHLIGGSLSYEYIGQNPNGTYRYRVFATTYTDCGPSSNFPDPEATIPIAIYVNDALNPNANKVFSTALTLPLISFQEIQPDLPSSCSVAADICVEEAFYEAFIDLPQNFGGYWLYYDRCCRNDAVVNLQPQQGVGFMTFIPSPLVVNSSPFFNAPPTSYICAGDTATFLNTAIDPDGDLLVFSFINPFRGYSTATNPNPGGTGYPNPLNWPVPLGQYNAGYNVNQPFGAGGYSFINGSTGLTSYFSPNSGQFSIGVEIKEYRDGNLIGITRRDLQLLVINCPPNPAPNITANGTGITEFTINEGEQICFQVGILDVNGDSLFLTAAGEILDPNIVVPTGTINTPLVGQGTVSADFCWQTSCDQGRENSYFFSATATDNGCPPKSANVVYTINVIPFTGSTFINGDPNACEFGLEQYTTDLLIDGDYVWTVSGGSITAGQGTNAISVEWGPSGTGQISVTATNNIGCIGDPMDMEVPILPLPAIDAGDDQVICLGDTVTIGGSPTGPGGSFYIWTPNATIISPNTANPQVFPTSSGSYQVTVVSAANCSATDTLDILVNEAILIVSANQDICAGTSAQLNASGGVTYTWTPDITLDDGSIADPLASPGTTTLYHVDIVAANTCEASDSVLVTVFEVPVADAGIDSLFCGSSIELYAAASVGQGTWTFPAGIAVNGLNNPSGIATATAEGTYTMTWTEVNGGICSDMNEVELTFIDQPVSLAGADQLICGLSTSLLAIPSAGTGTWSFPAGLIIDDQNSATAVIIADDYGTYTLTWTEQNITCTDSDEMSITFTEAPVAEAGSDDAICGTSYSLSASPSAGTGTWTFPSGVSVDDLNDPNTGLNLAGTPGPYTVTWTEDNGNGCIDSETITITFDPFPVVSAGDDQEVCGLELILEGLTDAGNGTWTFPADLTLEDINAATSPVIADAPTVSNLTWTVNLNGCISIDDVELTFLETPIPSAGPDEELCISSSITLNATGGDSYLWSPANGLSDVTVANPIASPNDTITYTVLVSLDNGCEGTDEMTIIVHDLPVIDAGEDVGYLCTGDSIQLGATLGFVSYDWVPTTGLSDATVPNPYAAPNTTAVINYIVTVEDVNGCFKADTVQVTVNPIVPTEAGLDTTICNGEPVILGGSPTSPFGTTYIWSPNQEIDDINSANPIVTPEVTTTYTVQTSSSICTGQNNVTVTVEIIPSLPISIVAVPSCEGLEVRFINEGDEDLSYTWDLGDGTTSTEFSPAHEYGFSGVYIVTYTGESDLGCMYTADTLVDASDFSAYFPIELINVITPNGDGVNDVLDTGLRGQLEECIEMEVFNRWGEIVFRSSGSNTLWDGRTPAGQLVTAGVYFYFIDLRGTKYKGSVQVSY